MREPTPEGPKHLEWLKPNAPLAPAPAPDLPPPDGKAVTFVYKPSPMRLLLAAVFFSACGLVLTHTATTNDRGVTLNGLITLSREGATVIYWLLAGTSYAFVAAAVVFGIPQMLIERRVVLDDSSITIPGGGFSKRHRRVAFSDIRDVRVSSYKQYVFIKIVHAGGSSVINSGMLPQHHDARVILGGLDERMRRTGAPRS